MKFRKKEIQKDRNSERKKNSERNTERKKRITDIKKEIQKE